MNLKNLLIRLLFCLLFAATVFYIHSYRGELINNTEVQWQYLQDDKGKVYLALDVYAPSGIKVVGIFSNKSEITDCWQLINYPDWYKGEENFDKLSEFQNILHPYLPYNTNLNVLYTTGRYTFLYKWVPNSSTPIPLEPSIKIKYENIGIQNYSYAKHGSGEKLVSKIIKTGINGPVIDVQILRPLLSSYSDEKRFQIKLYNLVLHSGSSEYVLKNLSRDYYRISIYNESNNIIDSLEGSVKWDSERAVQVYYKSYGANNFTGNAWTIDFSELFKHIAAIIFIGYFVLICRGVGLKFVKWWGIVLDSNASKLIIPIFLGIILLTYLFFIVGIFKLLYFPTLFAILLMILVVVIEPKSCISELKQALNNQLKKSREAPWRVVFLILFGFMLFYNLSYCFVPATYVDGSGDIVNSYLPNLNDYVLSHSFQAPIQNSTNGIASQAIDVLRAVVMVFVGESGVYLLSFVYLLLVLAGVYLIGKELFGINSILIYLTALLFLFGNLFTESLHLGKLYVATLSFLLIALYSIRFSDHNKNYVLAALFWGFLTSQFAFFVVAALAYYLFVFSYSLIKHETIKTLVFRLYAKSLIVFFILCLVFNLKLVLEIGTFCVPGQTSARLSNFFLNLNKNNELYKYIDNNYIRHFYLYHKATMDQNNSTLLEYPIIILRSISRMNFAYIFLFFPILLGKLNKHKKLYFLEALIIACLIIFLFPKGNPRIQLYFIYPLIIIQFVIINEFLSGFVTDRFFKPGKLDFILKSGEQSLKLSSVPCIGELISKFIKQNSLHINLNFNNSKFRLDKIADRFFNFKITFAIMLFLMLPYFIFKDFPRGFFAALPDDIKIRKFRWVNRMSHTMDHRILQRNQPEQWFLREVLPVFLGIKSKYEYLHAGDAHRNFDHAMLIRQYSDVTDKILIVPVRFHSHAMRHITARHALGSVIYQKDINQIMKDLKKININYLSFAPIHYKDYNPFYTPVFEEDTFFKYFKLLFSDNGRKFYKIIHDGTNEDYCPSPFNVKGLPFIPMIKTEKE